MFLLLSPDTPVAELSSVAKDFLTLSQNWICQQKYLVSCACVLALCFVVRFEKRCSVSTVSLLSCQLGLPQLSPVKCTAGMSVRFSCTGNYYMQLSCNGNSFGQFSYDGNVSRQLSCSCNYSRQFSFNNLGNSAAIRAVPCSWNSGDLPNWGDFRK